MISLQAAVVPAMQRHIGCLGWGHPMKAPPLHRTCHIGCLSSIDIDIDGIQITYQLQLQVKMADVGWTLARASLQLLRKSHCRCWDGKYIAVGQVQEQASTEDCEAACRQNVKEHRMSSAT